MQFTSDQIKIKYMNSFLVIKSADERGYRPIFDKVADAWSMVIVDTWLDTVCDVKVFLDEHLRSESHNFDERI